MDEQLIKMRRQDAQDSLELQSYPEVLSEPVMVQLHLLDEILKIPLLSSAFQQQVYANCSLSLEHVYNCYVLITTRRWHRSLRTLLTVQPSLKQV